MKAVLPLAFAAALIAGAAQAAGSGNNNSMMDDSSSMGSHQQWNANQIKDFQTKLKQQGYDVGDIDGKVGPSTRQAVRQFQEDKGLQANGQINSETMAALNSESPAGSQTGQVPGGSHIETSDPNSPANNSAR